MKPTPCPSRLKELIAVANIDPDSDARKHLRAIAHAFRAKRTRRNTEAFVDVETHLLIRIELEGGKITGYYEELALALNESGQVINRIRACPICGEIFWAGRADREACTRHAARWRQQEKRRNDKSKKEQRAKERLRRTRRQAEKPITFSVTTATICDAIFARHQTTERILDYCWLELSKAAGGEGKYSGATIHRSIESLVKAGYITPGEEQEDAANPFYAATEKLKKLRRTLTGRLSFRELVKEKERPATH